MTTETGSPRSRRALLAAGAAAGVATVASALGRPSPASAAGPGAFDSADNSIAAVSATQSADVGRAVNAIATNTGAVGVYATASGDQGKGVFGYASLGTGASYGVLGQSDSASGTGVRGHAGAGSGTASIGVNGTSWVGTGVAGWSDTSIGVHGRTSSTSKPGILGESWGGWTAIQGYSGAGGAPAAPAKTGVHGYAAQDSTSIGVKGETIDGYGVLGTSSTQVGVGGTSASGYGVYGLSTSSLGIYGYSGSHTAIRGTSDAAGQPAILGLSQGGSTGVQGFSGAGGAPAAPTKTGVYGYAALDSASIGVLGASLAGIGVSGTSETAIGVHGRTSATAKPGVLGESWGAGTAVQGYSGAGGAPAAPAKTGVHGYANQDSTAIGVKGETVNGYGVYGMSTSYLGVAGTSDTSIGVYGRTSATNKPGVLGESWGAGTAVQGYSGAGGAPAAPAKTGVHGYANQDATAVGVKGQTTAGRGVYGVATTGTGVRGDSASAIGVRGQSTSGTAGYFATTAVGPLHVGIALRTVGRVRLDKSAGIASIPVGLNKIAVTPGIALGSTSAIVATLMGSAGGMTNVHRVAVNSTTNSFTIYLTANNTAASPVKVAWHVFG